MARKLQLRFGGGMSDVVLSLSEGKFYDYEADRDALHARYGGKAYYTSLSGLSGAGFLQPSAEMDDLVKFGTYRTDAGLGHQHLETVHSVGTEYSPKSIFGYAPTASHGGIQYGNPFVLTDGNCVALAFGSEEVIDTLKHWNKVVEEAREFKIHVWWWDMQVQEDDLSFLFYNPHRFVGVDALRFVDLRQYCPHERAWQQMRGYVGEIDGPHTSLRLGLTQTRDWTQGGQDCWLHMGRHGVFDAKLEVSPIRTKGEIVDGWSGDGTGLVWRRKGMQIESMMEIPYATLVSADSGLFFAGQPTWIEYEATFEILDWFTMDRKARTEYFIEALIKKAQEMKKWYRPVETLLARVRENPNVLVTLADSYAVGNCRPGTTSFMERYELTIGDEGISLGELFSHPKIEDMFLNEAFRRTLEKALERAMYEPNMEDAKEDGDEEEYLGPTSS